MRRKDREKDRAFALAVVDSCPYGVLSMTLPEGRPYAVPLSIVREGDFIYFHSALEGLKNETLLKNPQVCLTCVDNVRPVEAEFTTEYASAILFGEIALVEEQAERFHALRLLCRRYAPGNLENVEAAIQRSQAVTAIWRIRIQSITGKGKSCT